MHHAHHHSHFLVGRPILHRRGRAARMRENARSMLASPAFWLGGAVSLALWAAVVVGALRWA